MKSASFVKKTYIELYEFVDSVISDEINDLEVILAKLDEFKAKLTSYSIDSERSDKLKMKIQSLKQNPVLKNTDNKIVIKGNSLLNIVDDYTVIDIETTGLSSKFDRIIEISAIKIRDSKVHSKYDCLVNPKIKIDRFIEELTGITNKMLTKELPIEKVIDSFIDFIGSDVLVGHNINFDIQFINQSLIELSKKPLNNDFIDTLRISRRVNNDFPDHKLETLIKRYNLSRDKHRAIIDCMLTHQIYQEMKSKIINEKIELSTKKSTSNSKLKELISNVEYRELNNYFNNKKVCFSGELCNYQRIEASQLVIKFGGQVITTVNKNLNILVLGNEEFNINDFEKKSSKHKKAIQLRKNGLDVEIINEDRFIQLLNNSQ
jgi:DNA polymerase-3 subunit epsilon